MLSHRLIVVAGLALVSAGPLHSQQRLPGGLTPRELTLYARILAMADGRQLDLPSVDRALAAKWRPLRAAAALSVGQVGAPGLAGAPRLKSLLRDRDETVAANAAYALGLLRDSTAVGALASAVAAGSPLHDLTREAAWALGEIGSPARPAIIAALSGGADDHDTEIQILLAAAKLRPVPVAAVRPYLKEAHPSVLWAAAYAISRTRASAGVRDLIDLEASPAMRQRTHTPELGIRYGAPYLDAMTGSARARAEIARALTMQAAGDSLGEQAFAVLARLVGDADPHVRVNAVRSVSTYGPRARDLVLYAIRDADANVRVAAAQSLGGALPAQDAAWASLLSGDTSAVMRASVLASAAKAGARPPELKSWLTSGDWRLRAAVANAAGDSLDRSFAITRGMSLIADPDPRVREAAISALAPPKSAPLEDNVHAALLTSLRDPDAVVRATALGVLADRPDSADLGAVLESYRVSSTDSLNDARLAAVQYFGALWRKDTLNVSPTLAARLAALPAPRDPLERGAARGIPPLAAWATVAGTPRPLGWYEGIVRSTVLPAYRGKTLRATIYTSRGNLRLELFGTDAPLTVSNFLTLARSGYYRNTTFHRVVPNFVIQDGDPRDDGNGGPGYAIRDEMNRRRYERGALGMALSGPDTGGSQYFITHSPQPHLDGHYTVFGRLVGGFEVLDAIVQGDRIFGIDPR